MKTLGNGMDPHWVGNRVIRTLLPLCVFLIGQAACAQAPAGPQPPAIPQASSTQSQANSPTQTTANAQTATPVAAGGQSQTTGQTQTTSQSQPTTQSQSTATPSQSTPSAKANEVPQAGLGTDSARKASEIAEPYSTETNPGVGWGLYEVKQSAEVGGRISSFGGSTAMWDTLVNLGTGPRLMEYTLDMHSKKHDGLLFDDLSFSNFGYGGDPNDVSRLRMNKIKIYDFDFTFRRDQNIFDYDLFANPLNPATSVPNIPVLNSPHEVLLTRRMSDFSLKLFPQSRVQFKFGYSRIVNQGSAFSTTHQGTEGLLLEPTHNTTDRYQAGISIKLFPKTNISYDQFYTFYKGDTNDQLAGLPFNLAGNIPVDLGLPFNSGPVGANQPCATPILGTGFANPSCNGYFSYNINNRIRNNFPTEQFSFQSSYLKEFDFSGRVNYSDGRSSVPAYFESFNGLITRTAERSFQNTGPSMTDRLSLSADAAITWHLTDRMRLIDTFRYSVFRIPGFFDLTTNALFGPTLLSTPNAFTAATCPPPFTAATCPQHSNSSGADVVNDVSVSLLKENGEVNTLEMEYDFSKRFVGHAGFRFEHRDILDINNDTQLQTFFPNHAARGACAGQPILADGSCQATVTANSAVFAPIHGYSAIAGFAAHPIDALRIRFDTEIFYADNTFTRISPRHMQTYRLRTNYKPREWMNFGGAVTIFENRNNDLDIGNLQHNRSYSIYMEISPPHAIWGFDASYDYNDIYSQTNICFVATPAPVGSLTCGTPFLSGISTYADLSHFVSGSFYLHPISRVTLSAGYTLTSTAGNTLILNPNAPTGPLSFNYHLPIAALAVQISKNFTYKANWNFYDYNEKSNPGPTLPRNFRGNLFTLSLRYAM